MSLILCLETSGEVCSVALFEDSRLLQLAERDEKNIHAAVITLLVKEVLDKEGKEFKDLSAVSVSKGPGSYTGLRVGVSAAKGICYALDIPLLSVNTLQAMAWGFREQHTALEGLFCPMLDARRMEVYTAVFDKSLKFKQQACALILSEGVLGAFVTERIHFFGSGSFKMKPFVHAFVKGSIHEGFRPSAAFLGAFSHQKLLKKEFEDVAYFDPFYLKDFVGTVPRKLFPE
jgi:tRNA threonylcarbamoyladenosine biosynthesis protein TsaB